MTVFRGFEREAIRLLVEPTFGSSLLERVFREAEFVSYEHSGVGYFLTVRHSSLPNERAVYSDPWIAGRIGEIECSFIVFVENCELTLECAPTPPSNVPEDFRDMQVAISVENNSGNAT